MTISNTALLTLTLRTCWRHSWRHLFCINKHGFYERGQNSDKSHANRTGRFCGHQTALISIRSITEFGAYCRSVCTVLAFATSVTWRSGWSRNGSALVRKSSIGLSSSGAHVCGRVSLKEEDTSNINCSLDTLGIDSLTLTLAVLEIFLFHCVDWIIYKTDTIRCICLKLCTHFRVRWLILWLKSHENRTTFDWVMTIGKVVQLLSGHSVDTN